MKVGDFSAALRRYARMLDKAGDVRMVGAVNTLIAAWSGKDRTTMKNLITKYFPRKGDSEGGGSGASRDEVEIAEVVAALRTLRAFGALVAKQGFNRDLDLLIESLASHERASIGALAEAIGQRIRDLDEKKPGSAGSKRRVAQAVDQALVDDYVARLEASYKDAKRFASLFSTLKGDRRVRKAEMVAIAKAFAGSVRASISKREALDQIWKQHEFYATAKAKSDFFGGRSAA